MAIQTADNKFSVARILVDATPGLGTHTTIGAALTAASAGDTIFIKTGTYTENLTLKAGVNLAAFAGDEMTPNVTIIGKLSASFAGTCSISNIRLQTNSDFLLEVSGSSATAVNLNNCYINAANNTAIGFSSSNASASISIYSCIGNIASTGIALFSSSSAGSISFAESSFLNSGNSTTASTISAGTLLMRNAGLSSPITTSGTASIIMAYSVIVTTNVTCLTVDGSGTSIITNSRFSSGTASAISIGASGVLSLNLAVVGSSNTNAITGAGTLIYGPITFIDTSSTINTTTQTPQAFGPKVGGVINYPNQPCFLANNAATVSNVTGDGTIYTAIFGTEIFDQSSSYDNTTGVFTAPVTGKYLFCVSLTMGGLGAAHTTSNLLLNTSNRVYTLENINPGVIRSPGNTLSLNGSMICDLDAGDTAYISFNANNGTKTVGFFGNGANSFFSGKLVA